MHSLWSGYNMLLKYSNICSPLISKAIGKLGFQMGSAKFILGNSVSLLSIWVDWDNSCFLLCFSLYLAFNKAISKINRGFDFMLYFILTVQFSEMIEITVVRRYFIIFHWHQYAVTELLSDVKMFCANSTFMWTSLKTKSKDTWKVGKRLLGSQVFNFIWKYNERLSLPLSLFLFLAEIF